MVFTFDTDELRVSREEFIKKHVTLTAEQAGELWDKHKCPPPETVKEATPVKKVK